MGVAGRPVRNSKTACWNTAAPSIATLHAPPPSPTNPTRRRLAMPSSSPNVRRVSLDHSEWPLTCWRSTSAARRANGISRAVALVTCGDASCARCRNKTNRSWKRAPNPVSHSLTVSAQTPTLFAATPALFPSTTTATAASKTTSTPVTFPGSASYGRTRSRCPHPAQRANAISSIRSSFDKQ